MTTLSAIFFFLSQHPFLSFPLFILAGLALGGALSSMFRRSGWWLLGPVGFVAGMANVFTGSMINGIFVNAYGVYGSAVITHEEETNSDLNDRPIWYYEAVIRTADGQDVKTSFDTMSASLYPWRNQIDIPPKGERFVVKYIPGDERNIAIMRDESPFGKRLLVAQAREPVEQAAAQLAASPANAGFRQEYRDALQQFLTHHAADAPPGLVDHYRRELQTLDGGGGDPAR